MTITPCRRSAIAFVAVASLMFTACEDDDVLPPPAPPVIAISPSAPITLEVGQQATVLGQVTGIIANRTVTYSSSVPAVATVHPFTGVVTAVAPGTAVITAAAAADTNVRASVLVIVTGSPPVVEVVAVTTPSGTPVNPAAVKDTIVATVNASAHPTSDVRSVVVHVDNIQVCKEDFAQPLGTTQGVSTIQCPINTAGLDDNGVARFANGPHKIEAIARDGTGAELATGSFPTDLTFANDNTVSGQIVFGNHATGLDGFIWQSGDVVVELFPAIYTGATLGDVQVAVDVNCNGVIDPADNTAVANVANGWTAAFPLGTAAAPGPLRGFSGNNVCFWVANAVTETGQGIQLIPVGSSLSNPAQLPGAGANPFRVDNTAPTSDPAPSFPLGWFPNGYSGSVPQNFVFSAAYPLTAPAPWHQTSSELEIDRAWLTNITDLGVGVEGVTFHAAPESDVGPDTDEENRRVVDTYPAINSAATLPTNTLLQWFAEKTDRLGNGQVIRGHQFRVIDPGLVLSTVTMTFVHGVGVDGCPQVIGTLVLTNPTDEAIEYQIFGSPEAAQYLLIAGGLTGVVPAGSSRTLTVGFNCGTQVSFTAWIEVVSRKGGQDLKRERVNITGTIIQ